MNKKYESEMLEVIHEDMKGMHKLKIINDVQMDEFDKMCLTQEFKSDNDVTLKKADYLSSVTT